MHLLDRHQEENQEEVGHLPKVEQEADRVVPVVEMEAIELSAGDDIVPHE